MERNFFSRKIIKENGRSSRPAHNPSDRPQIKVIPLKQAEFRVPATTHVKTKPGTQIRIETAEETFEAINPGASYSRNLPFGRAAMQNVEHSVFTPVARLPLVPHQIISVAGERPRTIGGGTSNEALRRAIRRARRKASRKPQ